MMLQFRQFKRRFTVPLLQKISLVFTFCLLAAFLQAQPPTSLQYPTPNAFIANVSSVYLAPTVAGSLTGLGYTITPALPSGLVFNNATGVISGVPLIMSVTKTYTITAANTLGSTTAAVGIGVTNAFFDNAYDSVFFNITDTLRKVGTGTNSGDVILYQNVRTINSQSIDCIVKTRSVSAGASFSSYDQPLVTDGSTFNSNNPRYFSPQLTFPNGGGNIIFDFQFIAHNTYNNATGTGLNVILQNVKLNTYDIDGNGTASSNQYNEFAGFDTSEVGSASTINAATFDATTNLTKYLSNISTNSLVVTADATRIRLSYRNMSSFSIQVGGGAVGAAYFFLDFSSGPVFSTGVKTTPPTIDLNTTVIGTGNGASGCANSLPFTASGQPNAAAGTAITELFVSYNNTAANLPDGASELLVIDTTTAGTTSHALNFTTGSTSSVTVGGVAYTITKTVVGQTNKISFKNGATTFTLAQAEMLLDRLRYDNSLPNPTSGGRIFTVNIRNTQFVSPDAVFTATLNCVAISGNIYHDANGLTDGIVNANGSMGQFAAAGAYAVLTNTSTNAVVATVPVAAGGAFSFGRVDPAAYSIYISNTATPGTSVSSATYPAGNYKSTAENLGAVVGNDGLTDGKLPVTLGTIAITNANLGVQIPPVAIDSTFSSLLNPGGFNFYKVPPAAFKISDADGSVDSLIITAFPTGANYLKVGSTVYINGGNCPPQSTCTTWPGSLRLAASAINNIFVDPSLAGNTSVAIPYTVLDNGHFSSNNGSNTIITIPFYIPATPITVTGNVWNDADGNGSKAGTEPYTAASNSGELLYALLVQTTNTYSGAPTVYATTPVTAAATGYTFSNVPAENVYEVRIASLTATPGAGVAFSTIVPKLADNYVGVSTSNNGVVNAGQQTQNLVNGLDTVRVNKVNINFGIEQRPVADAKSFTAPATSFALNLTILINGNPSGSINANNSSLMGSPLRSLSGNDAEDCAAASSCEVGKKFVIRTLNSNTLLYYNFGSGSIPLAINTIVSNFNPANLTIYGEGGQGLTAGTALGFTYSLVDNAGLYSPAVTYKLQTTGSALPVKLTSFAGTVRNCTADLKWTTANEFNSKSYTLEQSTDGNTFSPVSILASNNAAVSSYQSTAPMPSAVVYYRLKMLDLDGTISYSSIIRMTCSQSEISIYPNPAKDLIFVKNTSGDVSIRITDITGRVVLTKKNLKTGGPLNISALPAGTYIVQTADVQHRINYIQLLKK